MAELNEKAADAVEAVAEGVVEHAPEIAEAIRRVSLRLAALSTAFGVFAGAAGAYIVASRRLETKYAAIAEGEIEEMRDLFRKRLQIREEKPDLSDLETRLEKLQYMQVEVKPPEGEEGPARIVGTGEPNIPAVPESVHNVFSNPKVEDKWDYEVERALRGPDRPYVIHHKELHEREDYEQITLTYYAGDDVLCDPDDKVVENQEVVVGIDNLDKFGHGSDDRNTVYIRNETLGLDIEVLKSEGTFAEEVHGFPPAPVAGPRERRPPRDE